MYLRQKRATENEKIVKKAIADGVTSVLKSKKNTTTDVAKEAMKVMAKSAAKKKAIKKAKGNLSMYIVRTG